MCKNGEANGQIGEPEIEFIIMDTSKRRQNKQQNGKSQKDQKSGQIDQAFTEQQEIQNAEQDNCMVAVSKRKKVPFKHMKHKYHHSKKDDQKIVDEYKGERFPLPAKIISE